MHHHARPICQFLILEHKLLLSCSGNFFLCPCTPGSSPLSFLLVSVYLFFVEALDPLGFGLWLVSMCDRCSGVSIQHVLKTPQRIDKNTLDTAWVLGSDLVRVIERPSQIHVYKLEIILWEDSNSMGLLASEIANINLWSGFQPNIVRIQCRAKTLAPVCPRSTERIELWLQRYLWPIQVWNSDIWSAKCHSKTCDHRLLIVKELQMVWSLKFWLQ